MPALQVTSLQVFARVAQETGLLGDTFENKRTLVPLVSSLGGIRGDRMEMVHPVLAARLRTYQPALLLKALQERKHVVRTWGVKGLFQVVDAEELPLFLGAVAPTALRWQKFLNARTNLAATARLRLLKRLCPETVSRDALREAFPDSSMRMFLIKEAAAAGHLVWANGDGPQAEFAWTEAWLGKTVEPLRGVHDLVADFLASYGPVEAPDVAAWFGVTVAAARRLISKHRVDEVQVEGLSVPLFILSEDAEVLRLTRKSQAKGLVVVPPGDPFRIAHRSRYSLGAESDETEGVVILDGIPVAAWSWGRGELAVRFAAGAPEKRILKEIHDLLDRAGTPTGMFQEAG